MVKDHEIPQHVQVVPTSGDLAKSMTEPTLQDVLHKLQTINSTLDYKIPQLSDSVCDLKKSFRTTNEKLGQYGVT